MSPLIVVERDLALASFQLAASILPSFSSPPRALIPLSTVAFRVRVVGPSRSAVVRDDQGQGQRHDQRAKKSLHEHTLVDRKAAIEPEQIVPEGACNLETGLCLIGRASQPIRTQNPHHPNETRSSRVLPTTYWAGRPNTQRNPSENLLFRRLVRDDRRDEDALKNEVGARQLVRGSRSGGARGKVFVSWSEITSTKA